MISDSIIQTLQNVLDGGNSSLHKPRFSGNEQRYVRECIASTFVSSVGAYIDRFETSLAAYTGALHAIVIVNGAAALQVVLNLAGVKHSDEVILPAPTFIAAANAVQYLNPIPHFADSEKTTLGLNPDALRIEIVKHAAYSAC